jgi:ABC-type Mn2+/Zn2+ transport system permease subunit
MDTQSLIFFVVVGACVAAASSYIGSLMVLKRMSLVGDALSHVALPGMAIAMTMNASPILGAFIALTLAVVGIWYLDKQSFSYTETLVGIFFTASLAIGFLVTDEPDLLEALFGNLEQLGWLEGIITILLSFALIGLAHTIYKKMMIMVVSEELAQSAGIKTSRVNLLYLLIVGAVVAIGIRFVGTLLTGALVIIPAAAAKNISNGMSSYIGLSVVFGVLSAVVGIIVASIASLPTGPIVVLTSMLIYICTFAVKITK